MKTIMALAGIFLALLMVTAISVSAARDNGFDGNPAKNSAAFQRQVNFDGPVKGNSISDDDPTPELYADNATGARIRNRTENASDNGNGKMADLRNKIELRRGDDIVEWRTALKTRLTAQEMEKIQALSRSALNELPDNITQLRERLHTMTLKKVSKEVAFRAREIAKNRMDAAKERFQNARENFQEAKNRYQETRQEFNQYREREQNVCQDETSQECIDARQDSIDSAKEHLSNLADMIVERLDELIAQIEQNDNLNETTAQARVDELNAMKSDVLDAKVDVEAATTKEEVKAAGEAIIQAWNRIRIRATVTSYEAAGARIHGVIQQAENLEQRMEDAVSKLDNESRAALDDKITEFSNLVASAKDDFEQSSVLLSRAHAELKNGTNHDMSDTVKEANDLLRSAHDKLQDAHKILMDVVKALNQKGVSIEAEDEVTVVTESDDDSNGESDNDSGKLEDVEQA
ncbi:MAG: hypothetical protein ABIA93_05550 [Candidatus Woesearchaeota archaeon]